jgi:hypothetical protein
LGKFHVRFSLFVSLARRCCASGAVVLRFPGFSSPVSFVDFSVLQSSVWCHISLQACRQARPLFVSCSLFLFATQDFHQPHQIRYWPLTAGFALLPDLAFP